MSRRSLDPTPQPGEQRRAFVGVYLPPSGSLEDKLVCSICIELTKPVAKRMAALSAPDVCDGCGVEIV